MKDDPGIGATNDLNLRVSVATLVRVLFENPRDGQLMLALEDSMDQMLWIGESTTTLDKTYSLKEVIRQVSKVKIGELREAAKLIFKKENLNLALIGPLKASEEHIKKEIDFE